MLSSAKDFAEAEKDPQLTVDEKRKLSLAQKAREFAEQDLHLKSTKNYTTFVQLNRPYVTYVVSAAEKWQLKHYLWDFPFVGKMPYKGYFNEADAEKLENELKSENLDTFRRGVSAYSTLGWLKDPLLSSMLKYKDHDLVNTIIHETVHATIYIKNSADFNERLAVFLGNKGVEKFYFKEEGPESNTLKKIINENADEKLFSYFISQELKLLETWYSEQSNKSDSAREDRLKEIQTRFLSEVKPKLKTDNYHRFAEIKLNNARLLNYKTYVQDLSDFEKLYEKVGGDFKNFLDQCKSLEKSEHPEIDLKNL